MDRRQLVAIADVIGEPTAYDSENTLDYQSCSRQAVGHLGQDASRDASIGPNASK